MKQRKIYASREVAFQAAHSPKNLVKVFSLFPIDKADCECKQMIKDWKRRLGMATQSEQQSLLQEHPFLTCPRAKQVGMTKFQITCNNCGELQGYCYASDPSLKDWCDFHYVQWTHGNFWHGCLTPHVSPITEQLCLECCCGQDTRDFRANMKLPQKIAERLEIANQIGREFNQVNSKFLVRIAQ